MRDLAIGNTVGEAWCRFRVKVFGPKGMKVLHTGTFICRNHDFDIELPVPEALRDLKSQGYKTVLSTRASNELAWDEKALADSLGLRFVTIPMEKPVTAIAISAHSESASNGSIDTF